MTAPFLPRLILATLAMALSLGAAYLVPLDGVAHGGGFRLLGRLHPLLVHFPLGLLLLVPVLEWFGRRRLGLHEAAGFVLGLALIGSVVAVFAGVALAFSDGHEGELLSNHLWGGTAVTLCAALAWLVRERSTWGYRGALFTTVVVLGWAAHQGGSMTHGADYLIEPLPAVVKRTFNLRETPAPETYAADTVFGSAIHPIFEKHCLACHGVEKQKGEYRMDSFAALFAGGKSGKPAITAGELSQSELVRRMLLDPSDEKIMPPRKKARPAAGEIALLRWWIKQGASRELALAAVKDAPTEIASLLAAHGQAASAGEPVYVARVGNYESLQGEIVRLERELGIKLVPVSRQPGDGLILRARGVEHRFGDDELAKLTPLAPYIVQAELAGTRLTDQGIVTIKAFSQLERLHLERTAITGSTLIELKALTRLNYLNLCSTGVRDNQLPALAEIPSLRRIYLFGSRASLRGVEALRAKLPRCEIGSVALPPLELASPPSGESDDSTKL